MATTRTEFPAAPGCCRAGQGSCASQPHFAHCAPTEVTSELLPSFLTQTRMHTHPRPHTHSICAVCAFRNLPFRYSLVHSTIIAEVGTSDCSLKLKWAKPAVIHKYCQKTLNVIKDYFKYTKKLQSVCLITFSRFSLENLVFLSKAYSFVFDFSLSLHFQTYYNHHILALLQTLVTSGTSPALGEQLLEEGSRLRRSPDNMIHNASQVRCKLALLPLSKRLLTGVMVSYITEWCFTG